MMWYQKNTYDMFGLWYIETKNRVTRHICFLFGLLYSHQNRSYDTLRSLNVQFLKFQGWQNSLVGLLKERNGSSSLTRKSFRHHRSGQFSVLLWNNSYWIKNNSTFQYLLYFEKTSWQITLKCIDF